MLSKKTEIERKWLMLGEPKLPVKEKHVIRQAYLYADDNVEVRITIRYDWDTYFTAQPHVNKRKLTIKVGNGLVRDEAEILLTEEQAAQLLRNVQGEFIEKYFTICEDPNTGLIFEYSYVDPNDANGFRYSEVEFPCKRAAEEYVLPKQVLPVICEEVTGKPEWQMKNYWRRTRMGQPIK